MHGVIGGSHEPNPTGPLTPLVDTERCGLQSIVAAEHGPLTLIGAGVVGDGDELGMRCVGHVNSLGLVGTDRRIHLLATNSKSFFEDTTKVGTRGHQGAPRGTKGTKPKAPPPRQAQRDYQRFGNRSLTSKPACRVGSCSLGSDPAPDATKGATRRRPPSSSSNLNVVPPGHPKGGQ